MLPPSNNESNNLTKITEFRRGYSHFLNQFLNLATGLLNFLGSGNVSESVKRELIPFRKQIDSNIISSTQMARDLLMELDEKHMLPQAKKEIISYFRDGNTDVQRLDFVIFHKTFESLRKFFIHSKSGWTNIQYTVLSANLTDENFKSDEILKYRVIPVLDKLDSLKIFLERMSVILAIEDSHLIFKAKQTIPTFSEDKDYKLSAVFSEGLQKSLEDDLIPVFDIESSSSDFNNNSKSSSSGKNISDSSKNSISPQSKSKKLTSNVLNTAGKLPWNSNQHYYFRYDPSKYEEERAYFQSVINLETHLGADEKTLRAEVIRSMTSTQMRLKSPDALEGEYMMFLDNFFDFCRNILIMGMGIPDILKNLFFYHIGPTHFYMIVRKFLQEANTGYLHIRSSDGKKVTKFLPAEIIKKQVIAFWIREIMPNLGDERNNLAALKKIIEIVDAKYKEVSLHAIKEYDNLPLEVKASKPRVQIFREKMNTWMGAANIIVFKRFLKTAI
ncbi:MAG: hypothetical protein JJT78_10190 [Leptospira sp.]|nr:hypothetical protein [Leptospira sp.]